MRPINGKTIYILGAGASYHTGSPLLNDFLAEARFLMNATSLKYKNSFDRLFTWIDKLRAPAYYLDINLNNLEHVFSLISMKKEIDPEEGKNLYDDISYVMFETLEKCQIEWREKYFHPDPIYSRFVDVLTTLNEERRKRMKDPTPFEDDVIVSFNYDVMLDYVYSARSAPVNYCLESQPSEEIKLLKLHGSMNWVKHSDCSKAGFKDKIQIVKPSPIPEGSELNRLFVFRNKTTKVNFKMLTNTVANTKCKGCNQMGVLKPVFIPPTWSKNPGMIKDVWKATVQELKNAVQLVIIGYSLPATDTFFQYLLSLGLMENSGLYRIIIVDPDPSDDFKQRYENAFSKSLIGRGSVKILRRTFEDFINKSDGMHHLDNMEW